MSSPSPLRHKLPQDQPQQAAAAKRKLPFTAEQQHVQQSHLAPTSNGPSPAAEAQDQRTASQPSGNAAAAFADDDCSTDALPAANLSLADSHTWSVALQQYQMHRQQAAVLLEQQEQFADSCSSSSRRPAPAPADSCSPTRLTPASNRFAAQHAAAVQQQQEPCAAAACAAVATAARLDAVSSCSLQLSAADAAAANRLTSRQQGAQVGMTADCVFEANSRGNPAVGQACVGHDGCAGGLNATLSPDGLRLRVKALRGPLEDAMRCFTEVGCCWRGWSLLNKQALCSAVDQHILTVSNRVGK